MLLLAAESFKLFGWLDNDLVAAGTLDDHEPPVGPPAGYGWNGHKVLFRGREQPVVFDQHDQLAHYFLLKLQTHVQRTVFGRLDRLLPKLGHTDTAVGHPIR